MCTCEFCDILFDHRPQVKNPRACIKPECQRKRQQANEREWKGRNKDYPGKKYHKIRRKQRLKKINEITKDLVKCIEVGKNLLGMNLEIKEFENKILVFLLRLGIRRANKFWLGKNIGNMNNLAYPI